MDKIVSRFYKMRLPFIISVPHCAYRIPEEIRDTMALSDREILESADLGTRELFANLPVCVVLKAQWSRLVVDLNRSRDQRDPRGVVPEEDYFKRPIYRDGQTPDAKEVQRRLKAYYRPFHEKLEELIRTPDNRALFDCHSLSHIGPPGAPDAFQWRKDIVLSNNGDDQGGLNPALGEPTCPKESLQRIKAVFEHHGFSVSVNRPYSGGFITTHYGKQLMKSGKAAVQVEINQKLYLNEATLQLRMERISEISLTLHQVFREIGRTMWG